MQPEIECTQYNWCLEPKDKNEAKLFWDFRCLQIQRDFSTFIALSLIFYVMTMVVWLTGPSWESFRSFAMFNIYMLILVIIWLLGKRCSTKIVYLLPICLFVSYAIIIIRQVIYSDHGNGLNCWSGKEILQFLLESLMMDGEFAIFVLFFSPSLWMPMFVYSSIYIAGKCIQCKDYVDLTDKQTIVLLSSYIIIMVGCLLFLHYMIQMRELARFS